MDVRTGDRLLAIDGEPVNGLDQVRRRIAALPRSRPSALGLLRDDRELTLELTAQPAPLETLSRGRIELDEAHWRSHRLRLIWSWPAVPPPYRLIWLVPGATWLSEEHFDAPWHPLHKLVQQLTAGGLATLRVERSGLGDSEGPACTELGLDAELQGLLAARARIERRPELRAGATLLFGRSLGGMVVALLQAQVKPAGCAIWGSSARPWPSATLDSTLQQYRLSGLGAEALERKRVDLEHLHQLVYARGLTPREAFEAQPQLQHLEQAGYRGTQIFGRTARFFQQLSREDVAAAFASSRAPLLSLHGSCDWLSSRTDAEHIAALCAPHSRFESLAGLDHHVQLRESLEGAYAEPWGGHYSPLLGKALLRFADDVMGP